eukprot:5011011-Pyramimonas_sp.AAC.1
MPGEPRPSRGAALVALGPASGRPAGGESTPAGGESAPVGHDSTLVDFAASASAAVLSTLHTLPALATRRGGCMAHTQEYSRPSVTGRRMLRAPQGSALNMLYPGSQPPNNRARNATLAVSHLGTGAAEVLVTTPLDARRGRLPHLPHLPHDAGGGTFRCAASVTKWRSGARGGGA